MNATYRIMNKPLTYFGSDRRVFGVGLILAYIVWAKLDSLWGALAVFFALVYVGRIHAKDPTRIPLFLNAHKYKDRYEPSLGRPHPVMFYDDHAR
jgi:hypothetical protein